MQQKPLINLAIQKIVGKVQEKKYYKIASEYNICGYKRIYLIHIRKTGGTSLNNSFLSLSGNNAEALYKQLASKSDHRLISNGKVYVGWNVEYINKGDYFYAFSHTPLHKLQLPENTFTLTCFRDPVQRIISHYSMLINYSINKIQHPCMKTEGKWLGKSFDDFLKRIPREHLLNQLYMFSSQYNMEEAKEKIIKLSHYFFTEDYQYGVDILNKKTGLNLETIHMRKSIRCEEIQDSSIQNLRDMLDKEYIFLSSIQN